MIKTVILGGTEQAVRFNGNNTYYWVQNLSDADVLISLSSGIVDGADGVLTVPSKGAGYIRDDTGTKTLYILGTGKVQVYGTNNAFCPFKMASGGGDSGGSSGAIDEEARADIADINARVPYKILTGIVSTNTSETKITFSEAFETVPTVIGTIYYSSGNSDGRAETCHTTAVSTTGTTFETRYITASSIAGNGALSSVKLHWIAIGT